MFKNLITRVRDAWHKGTFRIREFLQDYTFAPNWALLLFVAFMVLAFVGLPFADLLFYGASGTVGGFVVGVWIKQLHHRW